MKKYRNPMYKFEQIYLPLQDGGAIAGATGSGCAE